jgi:hypothetical protein
MAGGSVSVGTVPPRRGVMAAAWHGRPEPLRSAVRALGTPFGRRVLVAEFLKSFGAVSALIEFLAVVFRSFPPHPGFAFAASLAVCAVWAAKQAYPRFYLRCRMRTLDVTLNIVIGDLFAQETHMAVGFSDTFDTSVTDGRIINSSSLQGQLLRRVFAGNQQWLDEQLAAALCSISPVRTESRADKPYGKLARYRLGTVAVLGEPGRLIFAVAYSKMGNDLVARAPVDDLWYCFSQLWEAVYHNGQRGPLSVPLMASGLARVDSIDQAHLLRLIVLSFMAYSRVRLICHELRIVIRPEDVDRVDLVSLREFLQTL